MLEEAKQELKNKIIAENSEEYYYKLVAERTENLHTFKMAGDFVFGQDDDLFREEVIKTTLKKNLELDESLQLYELVMTEIALDVFMDNA
jgi:hypothetical protein